jgi:arylsulfatase A-like enzyme
MRDAGFAMPEAWRGLRFILPWLLVLLMVTKMHAAPHPNILIIFTDDLGYGDVGCYNTESKVPTPNLDKLAREGMLFTDAHSPATVCTPSRYSLLTGQCAFRAHPGGVFTGVGGPCIIKEDRLTLPGMLRKKGYRTALFGKWHIGMTFFDKETGKRIQGGGVDAVRRTDFSRPIPDSPVHRGFDEFFGTVCCPTTDWLYTYIEGDKVTEVPTIHMNNDEKKRRNLPFNPYTRDFRSGLATKAFEPENVDLVFLEKSRDFLKRHKAKSPDKPFFLVHCTQGVHLPSIPAKKYRGKTEAGPHGDFIFELDDVVGQLMQTLAELGYAENTLVLFSSDNGPELPTVKNMRKDHQHDGARPWRGLKRDDWEGGHRVPLIVRWPGTVKPGAVSDQLVNLTDVMATCAAIVDYDLPNDAAEDSYNMLPALAGEKKPVREFSLQQAYRGKSKSIRKGKWKYLDHKGSGGNNYGKGGSWGAKEFSIKEKAPDAPGQLYNIEKDPGETNNLYLEHPEIVKELSEKLQELVASGRSAPER